MSLSPNIYYTNENGVIQLINKKGDAWEVKWIKWPNIDYKKELPSLIPEEQIKSDFMLVKELDIDPKCGCVRVVC